MSKNESIWLLGEGNGISPIWLALGLVYYNVFLEFWNHIDLTLSCGHSYMWLDRYKY